MCLVCFLSSFHSTNCLVGFEVVERAIVYGGLDVPLCFFFWVNLIGMMCLCSDCLANLGNVGLLEKCELKWEKLSGLFVANLVEEQSCIGTRWVCKIAQSVSHFLVFRFLY